MQIITYQQRKWIEKQKRLYRYNLLQQVRIDKLEKIKGWTWDNQDVWEEQASKLKKYMERYNRVPKNSEKYGAWCLTQKNTYHRCELSSYRIDFLESIISSFSIFSFFLVLFLGIFFPKWGNGCLLCDFLGSSLL